MTTPSSRPDGGPSVTTTKSSYSTGLGDEHPLTPEHPLGPGPTTAADVHMVVDHFFFTGRPGDFKQPLDWGANIVSSVTSVWVSACEVHAATHKPISGVARVEIRDVCPQDGGRVFVAGSIKWPTSTTPRDIVVRLSALAI
ncbi:hypothetical protein ACFWU3_24395 [Streptomyces sp. NPDC058685]|uniref:hypothetical protein n=1 Tax=Streptomyces sp. NPDC058685 TaxID=3346598 RepID=UPI003658BE4B